MLINALRSIVECPGLSSCFSSQMLHGEAEPRGFDGGTDATAMCAGTPTDGAEGAAGDAQTSYAADGTAAMVIGA